MRIEDLDAETRELLKEVINSVMALPQTGLAPYAKTYALHFREAVEMGGPRPYAAIETQLLYVQSNLDGGRGDEWKRAREAVKAALKHVKRLAKQ